MKSFFLRFFTWWNSSTFGTDWTISKHGERVGEDEQGNVYYRERNGTRRWVKYNGEAEASRIPPGWHGWLHHRVDTPPSDESYKPREWQKPHSENMTGTPNAHRPKGSILSSDAQSAASTGYEAWTPGD